MKPESKLLVHCPHLKIIQRVTLNKIMNWNQKAIGSHQRSQTCNHSFREDDEGHPVGSDKVCLKFKAHLYIR